MTEFMDARHVQDILLQQQGATYFALHCFPNSTKYHCTFEWMSETYQAYRVETGGFHTEEQAICMIAIAYLDAQDKKVIAQLEQMKEEDEDATK